MNKEYCYSWDGESYYGEIATEKEAIEEAKADSPEAESVYIGTFEAVTLKWCSCEEEIINSIVENLYDDIGALAEYFDVLEEDRLDLAKMIDKTVEEWIEKHGIKSDGYVVSDGHKVSLRGDK